MNRRPPSVTVISWIFIAFGCLVLLPSLLQLLPGAEAHVAEFRAQHPFQFALMYLGPVLAIICGIFTLRGHGWARWLLVAWFGYSLFVDILHAPLKLFVPALLFGIAIYFLFRPEASAYFRKSKVETPKIPSN